MRRNAYGYGSYRGRGGASGVLKVIAVVLAVILILAVAAFFYLQRYLVYTDDGQVRLEVPFLSKEDPEPGDTPLPVVSATPSPEPTPRVVEEALRPVALGREALYDGTAAESVMAAGGNAALFDMKGDQGDLGWVSEQELAVTIKVFEDDPAVNVAMKDAAGDDSTYRIARVSCFKDQALPDWSKEYAILTNSGYRWTDPEKVRWTSPANADVRDYLTGLCAELAGLGFDEILLDNAGYPDRGHLEYIKRGEAYDPEALETVISGFYAQVAQALEDTGVRLAVVWDPEPSALTGQTQAGIEAAGAVPVILDENGAYLWPETAGIQVTQMP